MDNKGFIFIAPLVANSKPFRIPWSDPPDFGRYFSQSRHFPPQTRYIVAESNGTTPANEYTVTLADVWQERCPLVLLKRDNPRGYILFGWCVLSRNSDCPFTKISPQQRLQFTIDIQSSQLHYHWVGVHPDVLRYLSVAACGTIEDVHYLWAEAAEPCITTPAKKQRTFREDEEWDNEAAVSSIEVAFPSISHNVILPVDCYFYGADNDKMLLAVALFIFPECASEADDVLWKWAAFLGRSRTATASSSSWSLHDMMLADQPINSCERGINPLGLFHSPDSDTIARRSSIVHWHRRLMSLLQRWLPIMCQWLEAGDVHPEAAITLLDVQAIMREHYVPLFRRQCEDDKDLPCIRDRIPLSHAATMDDATRTHLTQLYRYFHDGSAPPSSINNNNKNTMRRRRQPAMYFMDEIDEAAMPLCLRETYRHFMDNGRHLIHPRMMLMTSSMVHLRRLRGLSIADAVTTVRQWYAERGVNFEQALGGRSFVIDLENYLKEVKLRGEAAGEDSLSTYAMRNCQTLIAMELCPHVARGVPQVDIEDLCKNDQNQIVHNRCNGPPLQDAGRNPANRWYKTSQALR